jgi:hypothetical protein
MTNFRPLKRRKKWYNQKYLLDCAAFQVQQELKRMFNETKRNESNY